MQARMEKLHPLSDRLAYFGIMWAYLMAPRNTIVLSWSEGFQRALNQSPLMPTDACFSDNFFFLRLLLIVFPFLD